MAVANQLTNNAWILETNAGEKLGVMSLTEESGIYTITSTGTQVTFNSLEELEIAINERVTIKEREQTGVIFKDIEGYPIQHEAPEDIKTDVDGVISYSAGKRKRSRFLAGYWAVKGTEIWYPKLGITETNRQQLIDEGFVPVGPFKDKVEASFAAKRANKELKDADK